MEGKGCNAKWQALRVSRGQCRLQKLIGFYRVTAVGSSDTGMDSERGNAGSCGQTDWVVAAVVGSGPLAVKDL